MVGILTAVVTASAAVGKVPENLQRFRNPQPQNISDRTPIPTHFQRLVVKPAALAPRAQRIGPGQKHQLDLNVASPRALRALALFRVIGKLRGIPLLRILAIPARLGSENTADSVKHPGIRRQGGTRSAPDGFLRNRDDATNIRVLSCALADDICHQRRLTRTRHASHRGELAQAELQIELAQVPVVDSLQYQLAAGVARGVGKLQVTVRQGAGCGVFG